MVRHLQRAVELDDAQVKAVRVLLTSSHERVGEVLSGVRPKMREIHRETHEELRKLLRPEQQKKLDALRAAMERKGPPWRWGKDDKGRRGGRGGPGGRRGDRGGPDRGGPDRGGPDRGGPDRGGPDRGRRGDHGGPDRGDSDRGGPDRGGHDRGRRGRRGPRQHDDQGGERRHPDPTPLDTPTPPDGEL